MMQDIQRFARVLAAIACLLPTLVLAKSVDLVDGRRVYEQVCAACHGPAGRADPASPILAAFETPPADLSDPLFNSREPANDWELVVAHGGHAMGLSALMPAQQGALSADEIRNVVAYVKTLADTSEYPPGEFNYFLPIRTKKAFPEDEVVWKTRYTPLDGGPDVLRNVIEFEKRVGKRGMVVLELIHEDNGVDSELTKVEAGYKHALGWNAKRQSVLSGAVILAFPTDGGASDEIIPYLAYGRMLGDNWVFQSSARAITPFEDPGDGELELAGALHYRWTPWPRRVFPGIELVAEAPYDGFGGDVQWSAIPQVRIGLTKGGHVALNLGVEVGLSDQPWDHRAHAVLLWDFADGSFSMRVHCSPSSRREPARPRGAPVPSLQRHRRRHGDLDRASLDRSGVADTLGPFFFGRHPGRHARRQVHHRDIGQIRIDEGIAVQRCGCRVGCAQYRADAHDRGVVFRQHRGSSCCGLRIAGAAGGGRGGMRQKLDMHGRTACSGRRRQPCFPRFAG